jgi:hypothetical protein
MRCAWCRKSYLRSSRFKFADILQLFLLRYPVRCRLCNERDYAGWFSVLQLYRTERSRRGEKLTQ